jgi:GntR family transcriptional regulator/MocR family aminotransferase
MWSGAKDHFVNFVQTTLCASMNSRRGRPGEKSPRRTKGWAEFYDWRVDRARPTPIFRQVYLQIRSAILFQALPAGTKLPSTRELALRLSVSRASIVSAYEQLFAEGYLSGKAGSGTYVSSDLPEPIEKRPAACAGRSIAHTQRGPSSPQVFREFEESTAQSDERPFNTGRLLVDARTLEIWRKATHRALRSFGSSHLGYTDPCGLAELRTAICDYLRAARAVRCNPNQIIVTAGTQQAIDIAIRVLFKGGDEVWIEDPGYPLTSRALLAAGVKIRPISVDAQGLDVDRGVRLAPRARAAVVTPSHQYPTGVVLSMARRLELLAWAREARAWIIEDDYASEFRYSGRPLASLQGLDDSERVIYLGTLNKTLFPGLRIGYAVVPRALLQGFVSTRYLIERQPPSLNQVVLAEFMREGYLASHIRRMRILYREQRDALAAELSRWAGTAVTIDVPDQGMHLNVFLRDSQSDVYLENRARQEGVIVRAMSRLYKVAPPQSALMLGFAGYPRQMIIPAAARLAQLIMRESRLLPRVAVTSRRLRKPR